MKKWKRSRCGGGGDCCKPRKKLNSVTAEAAVSRLEPLREGRALSFIQIMCR